MTSLFRKPKTPDPIKPPEPAPPPPTIDAVAVQTDERDRIRKRRGRAATILTGEGGLTAAPSVGAKTLLGS